MSRHKIWCEPALEYAGKKKLIQAHDSISEEERRRLVDMGLLDKWGHLPEPSFLPKTIRQILSYNTITRLRSREGFG